ncbi:MAG: pitrilysin family protein [Acidobacteriota bacterium]
MKRKLVHLSFSAFLLMAFLFPFAMAQDVPKIKFEKYVLDNGLQVILHEDHSVPMVTVNVWYHVGSKNEKRGRTGFAHLFEHMMFQGSEHQPGEYFAPLEKVGGDANGSTSEDRTNYWENVPSNYLELALFLEADRMGFLLPAMTKEKLDNQRDVVKNERRQGLENQPYYRSEEYLLEALYPSNHPYSWMVIGSQEDLTNASMEDVQEFFKQYYAPNNASLVIAGDFDPAQAKDLVEKYFTSIPPGPPITRLTTWVPELKETRKIIMEDRVSLPRIYMAWHTPPMYLPDDAELDILASILSSGKTSRLYKELVYDKQIAQEVWAYQDSREIGSNFRIVATAKPGHTLEELEKAIEEQLKLIRTTPPSEEEVAEAKSSIESGFIHRIEYVGGFGGKADMLNQYNTFIGTPDYIQQDLARYTKVTPLDVRRVAEKYLDPNGRVILYAVPYGEPKSKTMETDRSKLPAEAAEPLFRAPEFKRKKLSNGLEVILAEHHELPIVNMALVVNAGWVADPKDKPGVSSLTSELQDEGTKSRNALEISGDLKKIGATVSTNSFFDASYVGMDTLKKHLDKALEIFSDIIINPLFPSDELERKRKIYLGRIMKERMEPFTSSFKVFLKTLYGANHPYGQPFTGSGTEQSISSISREDLVKYYENYFHPNNAALVVVGDVTEAEIMPKLEAVLKDWKPGKIEKIAIPEAKQVKETKLYLIDKPGAPQSVIICGNLGITRNSPDYYRVLTMNNILGGQFTSRINMNLREDKGYTYGARSMFIDTKGVGPFAVFAPVHTQFTKEALVEIIKELNGAIGAMPVTEQELIDGKANLTKGYAQGFESASQITWHLANMVQFSLSGDTFNKFIPAINAVTNEDVKQVAQKYIHPDKMVVTIVGDVAKIEPLVRELNLGEVLYLDADGNAVKK